jgi:hypothetical protein
VLATILVLLAVLFSTQFGLWLREWYLRWGATDEEIARPMAGDLDIPNPTYSTTLAVTVDVSPKYIWPWLLQMGFRRGGLYSYDWLDRLFGYLDRPSATDILAEFQELKVGDEIPLGRGPGFPVKAVEPYRTLVLGGAGDGFAWTWQFGLFPLDGTRTRLISRNSVRHPRTVGSCLFMRVLEPAAFVMTRRMLLGLKKRAERLAASEGARPIRAAQSNPHRPSQPSRVA